MAITRRFCTNVILLLLCLLVSCEAIPDNSVATAAEADAGDLIAGAADPTESVFNVLQFGAKLGETEGPSNVESNHMAFVQAFNATCQHEGKARLLIPKGTFVIGPITFMGPCKNKTPLIVEIQATIKAITDISEFPGEGEEWVNFENINGLIITGGGTFDGQGPAAWKLRDPKNDNNAPGQRLPASILFSGVTDAIVRGISSVNSKGFHYFITRCQNFRMYHLNIIAPDDSPNTDGIHISNSNLVKIAKSVIGTGDDCVGMIRGSVNITITEVTCGPGHGISVGSLGKFDNETDVNGIIVKNCTLVGTDNGLRVKTMEGKHPSVASGMLFENVLMKDVKRPIIIDQYYAGENKESIVKVSDVRFVNISGTSVSKVAVDFQCSKKSPCQNIHLTDINLQFTGNEKEEVPFSSSCANAQVGYQGVQIPPPCK